MTKQTNIWDYVNNITEKKGIMEIDDSIYNSYMINKALSFFPDTILLVNEINLSNITNQMNYDFLYNIISKKRRFSKWHKQDQVLQNKLDLIIEYFSCNMTRAKEYLEILTDNDLSIMKDKMQKGG